MNVKNLGTGAGGSNTNKHGLEFEKILELQNSFQTAGFTLHRVDKNKSQRSQLFKVFWKNHFLGFYGTQSQIYQGLKLAFPNTINDTHIKNVLSKKIFPDAFLINLATKQLIIFEMKWQQSSGSVDEKIQTAPFKLAMFAKLLRNVPVLITYQYLLSSWFNSPIYRNIYEYYAEYFPDQIKLWIAQGDEEIDFNFYDFFQIKHLVKDN